MIVLPTDKFKGNPNHEYEITYEGVPLVFVFRWLQRIASWYMDILNPAGEEITVGIRIVIDLPLDLHRKSSQLPPNMWILARDIDGTGRDPELIEDLGTRITVMLMDRDSIPASDTSSQATIVLI